MGMGSAAALGAEGARGAAIERVTVGQRIGGGEEISYADTRGKAFWMGGTANAKPSSGSILGC